jgi:hypothetical protein
VVVDVVVEGRVVMDVFEKPVDFFMLGDGFDFDLNEVKLDNFIEGLLKCVVWKYGVRKLRNKFGNI